MLDKLTPDSFKGILGSDVTVTVTNGPDLVLTLEAVNVAVQKEGCCPPEGCRAAAFTLTLSGPDFHQVPDGIYDLNFEKVGVLTGIYLDNKANAPGGDPDGKKTLPQTEKQDDIRVKYEIVFS
ncbi:DUF6916 family protein [Kordiimonas gwangyangensis]|uniref:DUF6916 family protein n=1 Tax=Kordiimonas gwangyangensis TaxID=288022 RepID=UPI0003644D8E|nr:hypothetical protein [Kordiimonas gwangyangensis]